MNMLLHQDIVQYNIVPQLRLEELVVFGMVNKWLEGICCGQLDRVIIERINTRLGSFFGERVVDFKRLLQNGGGYVSGSFIIECILGTEWKTQYGEDVPLDIYVVLKSEGNAWPNKLYPFLHDLNYGDIWGAADYSIAIEGGNYNYVKKRVDEDYRAVFEDMTEFRNEVNTKAVVTRIFSGVSGIKYVGEIMDFDVCRNLYCIEGGVEKVEITNLAGILKMVVKCTGAEHEQYSAKRVRKYMDRGFRFEVG